MALIKCRECGHDVSTLAVKCPSCGTHMRLAKSTLILPKSKSQPMRMNLILISLVVIGGLLILAKLGSNTMDIQTSYSSKSNSYPNSNQETNKNYSKGEQVDVGYMSYVVGDAYFTYRLSSNPYLDEPPNAMYLVVPIAVQNNDRQARTIPIFKLIDENGAEYETSSNAIFLENNIDFFNDLNPGVKKRGFVVFDVPENHSYSLVVSGGFWSKDVAFVNLGSNQ